MLLDSRQRGFEARNLPEGHQEAHPHAGQTSRQEQQIKQVADVAVFLLQNAEGAMMGRQFIKINGNKRDDGGDGDHQGR